MNVTSFHLVIGLGESGLAMSRWLMRRGDRLRVYDTRVHPPGLEKLRDVAAHLGQSVDVMLDAERERAEDILCNITHIHLSPGISFNDPLIVMARERGISVGSELDLFSEGIRRLAPNSLCVAITGSNGKTTTTALVAHLLNESKIPAVACGNISPSVLDALMVAEDQGVFPSVWVVEVSSFQLESSTDFPVQAAVVLNISEDHLDRHGTMAEYARIKSRIYEKAQVKVVNRDDCLVSEMLSSFDQVISFGMTPPGHGHYGIADGWLVKGEDEQYVPLVALEKLRLVGKHNCLNIQAALALGEAVARKLGAPLKHLLEAVVTFSGLPHRVEWVARSSGVDFYDDSKGTNVGATLAAIEGLGRKIGVILGGEGKGQDFSPLRSAIAEYGRAVALIGKDAQTIGYQLHGLNIPFKYCADMAEAVQFLIENTLEGDAILLSPACASLDMYRNYGHRADVFVSEVRRRIVSGSAT